MMRKVFKIISIVIGSIAGLLLLLIFIGNTFGKGTGKVLLPVEHKEVFQNDNMSKFPGRLTVKENKIIDSSGRTVILKGLMAPDPQKLDFEDNFTEAYYKKIFETGGNIIRVPVHPDRWAEDKDYFWRYLDPVVSWAGENNNYVIIDLHFIGNIATGAGSQMPDIKEKPKEFTLNFWKQTAGYFKEVPNVIFEICNEPADITSDEWSKTAEEIVKTSVKPGQSS
jgi:aryl-phospho-beta-D-glucosidase BglC (GH1 family)